MAKINIGNLALSKAYLGEQEIDKIYLGDTLLYSSMPQLATPTIISLSGGILTIEEVENAEYYDIYVDGVLEESVPAVDGYSGDITLIQLPPPGPLEPTSPIITRIKFDTPPTSDEDWDSTVYGTNESAQLLGLTSYTNKTKVYVWGPTVSSAIQIDGFDYAGGSTYDTAVEVVLTGDYSINLYFRPANQNQN